MLLGNERVFLGEYRLLPDKGRLLRGQDRLMFAANQMLSGKGRLQLVKDGVLPTKGMNGSCQACVACCLVMDDQLQLPMFVLSMRYHTCDMVGARGTLRMCY